MKSSENKFIGKHSTTYIAPETFGTNFAYKIFLRASAVNVEFVVPQGVLSLEGESTFLTQHCFFVPVYCFHVSNINVQIFGKNLPKTKFISSNNKHSCKGKVIGLYKMILKQLEI